MRRALIPLSAIALLLLSGCDDEPVAPPTYPFTFTAHSDGQPLAL